MRLGLGMMRRAGRAAVADARALPAGLVRLPPGSGWEIPAGRWRFAGLAGWVPCPANEARSYVGADGELFGYLMEGAETFRSAPWHDPAAPHGTADFAYLAKTVAADAIVYAGGHALADIHGGTGKGVAITQGGTANGIFTANNVTCATVAGDIVRVEMLFSIPVTNGAAGTVTVRNAVRSGTGPTRALSLSHDGAGNITGWTTTPAANTYRAGYAPAGVKSDGQRLW
ncbi:MAG: hypothetical protein WCY11_03310, partial [Novosphingobium sp.]